MHIPEDLEKLMNLEFSRRRSGKAECGFVYLMQREDGIHKIGVSRHPVRRAKELSKKSSLYHSVISSMHYQDIYLEEACLHQAFAGNRIAGPGELFDLNRTARKSVVEWLAGPGDFQSEVINDLQHDCRIRI